MNKCLYYQAVVPIKTTHLFVAAFRYYEHIAFDRTLNAQDGIFEFFVPQAMQTFFVSVITYLETLGLVHSLVMLDNRL